MTVYNYDSKTKEYTVYSKSGRNISISEEDHKNMLIDYTVRQMSIQKICQKYKISPSDFAECRQSFGWTRDSLPVTDEEVLSSASIEELALTLLQRKANIVDTAQEFAIKQLEESASLWEKFKSGELLPFENALSKFSPPKPFKVDGVKKQKNGRWFCCGFSDFQIGSKADGRYLYRQEDWNTQKAIKSIAGLVGDISTDVKNDKVGFDGCVCLLAGDIIHGMRGKTEKGTVLEVDADGEEQIDAALTILYSLIENLYKLFGNVVVHTVRGNHDGYDHYPLMVAIKNYFKTNKNIEINIHSTRTAVFKVSNTMLVMDHGASDQYKADIPKNGKPRESYIQSLMLHSSKLYSECNGCLFVQGDKHHFEQMEFNDFEFIMLGALPLGDRYSDNCNWNSRSRQNCFVIDENGLKSVHHYYVS